MLLVALGDDDNGDDADNGDDCVDDYDVDDDGAGDAPASFPMSRVAVVKLLLTF